MRGYDITAKRSGRFDPIVLLISAIFVALVFFLSEEISFLDGYGALGAIFGARNIAAYHLRLPMWWWHGGQVELKESVGYQKGACVSNYLFLITGLFFIYFW